MGTFADRVHNYHNCIISSRFREFYNEVHAHDIPPFLRYGEGLEFADRSLMLNFCPKAGIAGGYIAADVPGHVWPPVVPRN
jgi:isoaspartyl peptidase/L-asparaginase-like protein (Ntn-hydrolase superfamily)